MTRPNGTHQHALVTCAWCRKPAVTVLPVIERSGRRSAKPFCSPACREKFEE